MTNKKLVKKIVGHTLHPERKKFMDNHIMHPDREWSIGLLIGLLICVSGVVWGLYTFGFYKTIEVESVDVEASVVVYRASLVDEALKDFTEREKIYSNLLAKSQPAVSALEYDNVQATTGTSTIEAGHSSETVDVESRTELEIPINSDLATSSPSSFESEENN